MLAGADTTNQEPRTKEPPTELQPSSTVEPLGAAQPSSLSDSPTLFLLVLVQIAQITITPANGNN